MSSRVKLFSERRFLGRQSRLNVLCQSGGDGWRGRRGGGTLMGCFLMGERGGRRDNQWGGGDTREECRGGQEN